MRGRILFGAGLAVGYVFGARAGRGAYDALRARADRLAHSPQARHAVDVAKHTAERVVEPGGSPAGRATLREDVTSVAPSDEPETATATD